MIRLQTDAELARAFPAMKQLRTHLKDEKEFIERVREGERTENYMLFGIESGEDIVALCGVQAMVTLYYDRCLWVCDLVTDATRRSQGYGKLLLSEVEQWARQNGFSQMALSSGLQRTDAHRFYMEKMLYDKTSFVFMKKL